VNFQTTQNAAANAGPLPKFQVHGRLQINLADSITMILVAWLAFWCPAPASAADSSSIGSPPPFSLEWGTLPRAYSDGREIESVYHLYGWSTDIALRRLSLDGAGAGATTARIAKAFVLDLPLAYIGDITQHELGDYEGGLLGGGRHITWSPCSQVGIDSFWHCMSVANESHLSPSGYQSWVSGGLNASQTAMDDMRRRLLQSDQLRWSFLPLFVMHKGEATAYPLLAHSATSSDPILYRNTYASRSGRSNDSVRRAIDLGAVWNIFDPMVPWSIYEYGRGYIWHGDMQLPSPMLALGSRQYMAGTGFWFSEVGPQYLFSAFMRNPETGSLLTLRPGLGDGGQWYLGAAWENLPLSAKTRAGVLASAWSQRAQAEPGPRRLGGMFGLSADQRLSGWASAVHVVATGGVKSRGAELGRQFAASGFVDGGLRIEY